MALNFSRISKAVLPSKIRVALPAYLLKAGVTGVPYGKYGFVVLLTVALNLLVYFTLVLPRVIFSGIALFLYSPLFFIIFEAVLLAAFAFGLKTYYDVRIYNRTRQINDILPEFLESLRNNLAAGQSFNRALMNSLHPHFAVLNEEIEIVAKKTSTGEDVELALKEFSDKYDSPLVGESVDILVLALKGGANVVEILDKLVESIRIDRELKNEVRASVASYIIFISIISVGISPILFALSLNLLNIFTSFSARLGTKSLGGFSISKTAVTATDFITFSRFSVIVITLFAGMIIAKLKKGEVKGYLFQIALYVAISIVVYEVSRSLLDVVFASMF